MLNEQQFFTCYVKSKLVKHEVLRVFSGQVNLSPSSSIKNGAPKFHSSIIKENLLRIGVRLHISYEGELKLIPSLMIKFAKTFNAIGKCCQFRYRIVPWRPEF